MKRWHRILARPAVWVATLLAVAGGARAADLPAEPGPAVEADIAAPKQRPLWELGLGFSYLHLPDYRGSDESRSYVLPLPYIVYRGRRFKSDRDGSRAMLFDSPRTKLDLSLNASAPASGDNLARAGMPHLPATLEIGPSLNHTLEASTQKHWKLDLRLPLRAAVTAQRSPKYVGATFSPNLNLDVTDAGGGWNLGLLTGPLFASRRYHEHYYGVAEQYATADRAAYAAHGGYAGWQALASTSRRIGPAWLGGFVRYENLSGAAYEDSPLLRRKSSLMLGFGVSWVLKTSADTVASPE